MKRLTPLALQQIPTSRRRVAEGLHTRGYVEEGPGNGRLTFLV